MDKQESYQDVVQGVPEEAYGECYREHILALYKMYVDMADRISARRSTANSFFLAINTGLVALTGYIALDESGTPNPLGYLIVGLGGFVLSSLWFVVLQSYKKLNSAKFLIIHEMEKKLPLKPYDAEWKAVGQGKDRNKYLPLTHVEAFVPTVFGLIYLYLIVRSLPQP